MDKSIKNGEEILQNKDTKNKPGKVIGLQSQKAKTLNQDVNERLCVYYTVFVLIGLVTNTGLVMVGSSAEDLAVTFHKETFMPMFQLSEILFASFVQFLNCWLLINVKHVTRLTCNAFYMLSAYLLITVVTIWKFEAGFWLALLAALMHGTSAALSESTVLGFMKGFPSRLVAPFSTGTGFAGIFGSGILLVLKIFFNKDGYIFLLVSPIIIIYLFCIHYLQRQKRRYKFDMIEDQNNPHGTRSLGNDKVDPFISPLTKRLSVNLDPRMLDKLKKPLEPSIQSEEIVINFDAEDSQNKLALQNKKEKVGNKNSSIQDNQEDDTESHVEDETEVNEAFSIAAVGRVFKHVGIYLFCLSTIYLFEYTILTCFADVYTKRKRDEEGNNNQFLKENSYIILTVCYQFGVLVSRGSLDFFKVKRLSILIILQIINFVLWFLNVYFFVVTNYAIVFIHISLVGMMGGTLYVNVLFNIVSSKTLEFNDKELAMILWAIFDDVGILAASIGSLALDNTVFVKYQDSVSSVRMFSYFAFKSSHQ